MHMDALLDIFHYEVPRAKVSGGCSRELSETSVAAVNIVGSSKLDQNVRN